MLLFFLHRRMALHLQLRVPATEAICVDRPIGHSSGVLASNGLTQDVSGRFALRPKWKEEIPLDPWQPTKLPGLNLICAMSMGTISKSQFSARHHLNQHKFSAAKNSCLCEKLTLDKASGYYTLRHRSWLDWTSTINVARCERA